MDAGYPWCCSRMRRWCLFQDAILRLDRQKVESQGRLTRGGCEAKNVITKIIFVAITEMRNCEVRGVSEVGTRKKNTPRHHRMHPSVGGLIKNINMNKKVTKETGNFEEKDEPQAPEKTPGATTIKQAGAIALCDRYEYTT